jgi:rubrerythrin
MSQSPIRPLSRRSVLAGGAIAGLSSVIGLSVLKPRSATASSHNAVENDLAILNTALYYEHQAIWAYGAAAPLLSNTDVGQAVLAIALANQADHMEHRDTLASVIRSLGGMPVEAEDGYDLSAYINAGEGDLDSDANIAKLALALEVDAAIAYAGEVAQLQTPELVTAGATIASAEASHATMIRAAFVALGMDIKPIPAAFVSAEKRPDWILMV